MIRSLLTLSITTALILMYGCAGESKSAKSKTLKEASRADSLASVKAAQSQQDKTGDLMAKPATRKGELSPASQLLIEACNNYKAVNPKSPKITEVMLLQASIYYNNGLFNKGRSIYQDILDKYPNTPDAIDALRMIAQSYYQENNYDEAQVWFRKLRESASEDGSKSEASARIAESIFRIAEKFEKEQKYADAAAQYERVAMEFPNAPISDRSLFNAGLSHEKGIEWSKAILMYERLRKKYQKSELIPKAMFRTAKCYEKLLKWDFAGETYLRLVANYRSSKLVPTSLYNAGFCFENAEKYIEAASTFEKLGIAFPKSKDAADVLFKASELYGKINDWQGVTRVNKEFSRRYGNDVDRIVQAQCMTGVALYMQNKTEEAIYQLKKALNTYKSLGKASVVNKYYAAKAQFTLGDIYLDSQNKIKLIQPKRVYRSRLNDKSAFMNKAVEAYSGVLDYNISEWTTRSIFQIGQAYEDFAFSIFKQQRPPNTTLEKTLALEMGIAKAVEEYFVDNALHYYEQNVRIGIKEKIENESILNSKKKLTYLPFVAGKNYIALVGIAQQLEQTKNLKGFALIAQKLKILQKMAPFQERAIGLFLKCLEMGSKYQQQDEFYTKASTLITKTSLTVAKTYGDVAEIARSAPIPQNFDAYEEYIYKTKLLKQIEEYDENALTNYLKVLKISQAYEITDEYVEQTKKHIPKLLFIRARCYDLLCISAFDNPPYPAKIQEAEKEEYRAQFEEIALDYQEHAFSIYRAIIDYAQQGYAVGEHVNHAYARLFQNFPKEFGAKEEKLESKTVTSGPKWRCNTTEIAQWQGLDFNDRQWYKVAKEKPIPSIVITGFPGEVPTPMWYKNGDTQANRLFFRRSFYIKEPPHGATLTLTAIDDYTVFINENKLPVDSTSTREWTNAQSWDLTGKLRQGKNVLAVDVNNTSQIGYGLYPYLTLTITTYDYVPKLPGSDKALDKNAISEDRYRFPKIVNFEIKETKP